jgi:hypothetical protein
MELRKAAWKRIAWWTLFAASFGYIEAAVVVYIRRLTGMAPGLDYPAILAARGLSFRSPAILTEIERYGILPLELSREAATLLLLFGAAWAGGRSLRERLAIFGYTFAVWDLGYYVFLAAWIGFPRRLTDTDIYFLLPTAWYGPVWFPTVIVMPTILLLCLRILLNEEQRLPASQRPGEESPQMEAKERYIG